MKKNKFDIQLFADAEPAVANTTDSIGLSAEMKTYYEKRLLDNAEPNLVYNQFADKYPIPTGNGKTVEFRRFTPLRKNTSAITEGTTPAGTSITAASLTATVAQYGDWVQLTDMIEETAIDPVVSQVTKLLGAQAGKTLDTLTRDVVVGGTNVLYAEKDSVPAQDREELTADHKITPALIMKAAAKLKMQNASPIDGSYVAIIHPYVAYDLMTDKDWVSYNQYANPENIYNGEIGKIGNVRFVESTEAKIFAPGDIIEGIPHFTLNTKIESSTNSIDVSESLTDEQANEINTKIQNDGAIPIWVNGVKTHITGCTPDQSGVTTKLSLMEPVSSGEVGTIIRTAEGGKDGCAVFCTMVLGASAYATTSLAGGGLQHIIKPLGSGQDPLNQRSSVGWKATHVAKRLAEEYMIRIESGCSFSHEAQAN
ncbi:MAG: N4-gp56 family major capsid protein [Clostridiales bacterium]|nr:N4-gp56 family major capsid protein [Clostridiales bacterium]